MPKKKSKESKEEFEELDKLFDKDDEVKKSELEEDVELNLEDLQFHQFMQSSEPLEDKAPVLERIAGSQPGPVFVGGIPQTAINVPGEEEKTNDFKYVPGGGGNDEPKYIASDSRVSSELTPVDLMKVGRRPAEPVPQVNQETFSMHSEPHLPTVSTPEREFRAERIDIEKAGRRDVFEGEDVKYKPKLPKNH